MPGVPAEPGQVASLIQMTLVPVVMISAVGLITLVVQNRHAVVLDRTFRINSRRLELTHEIHELEGTQSHKVARLKAQLEVQDALLRRWLARGTYTRNALVSAFLGVLLFGVTSFGLVTSALFGLIGSWETVEVVLFLAGILAFIACFVFALIDVYQGLWITRFETGLVNDLIDRIHERGERVA